MPISPLPPVPGRRILLVGRFGHQNMGDELIMLGNIKQLLLQGKTIYLLIGNHTRVTQWLSQHIDSHGLHRIHLLPDIPRGLRSLYRYITQRSWYYHLTADTIILGGGEIITPEHPTTYRYRRPYIRPSLRKHHLIIMGGIQAGTKRRQRRSLDMMLRCCRAVRARDHEVVQTIQPLTKTPVSRVMDTSRYAYDRPRHTTQLDTQIPSKYNHDSIIININSKGLRHLPEIIQDIQKNISDTTHIYYVPVCAGPQDDDSRRRETISQHLISQGIDISHRTSILDWRSDFGGFVQILTQSSIVISPRLHMYLISVYLGLPTIVYPYQRKILKMQQELQKIGLLSR